MNPLVWVVSVCAGGLLFLLGVLSYQASDREVPPGTVATLQVQQVTTTEASALEAVQQVADDNGVNLLRVGANPAGPDAPPWYFAFVGDESLFASTFPDAHYPAFDPSSVPELYQGAQLAEKNQPIRGLYALQGMDANPYAIAASLTEEGVGAEATVIDPPTMYLTGLLESRLWPLLATAVIALVLAIVFWIASSRKASALQQFHGYTRATVVFRQTLELTTTYVTAMAVSFGLGSLSLGIWNGWNQYLSFIPWVLLPMLGVGVAAVVTQLTAATSALKLPAYAAVKGARPRVLLAFAAGLSQAVMLVLVFAALAQAVGGAISVRGDQRSFAAWDDERGSVSVRINPNAFEDPATNTFTPEVAEAYAAFGSIYRQMDGEGTAVLSIHTNNRDTNTSNASTGSYEPLEGNSMIVNNNYLERQDVRDTTGRRISEVDPEDHVVTLLIPEDLSDQADAISTAWAASTLTTTDPIGLSTPGQPFDIKTRIIADGQELFNYGSSHEMEQWTQRDPVVAVVSPESEFISDWMLLGVAANDGNVIFTDASAFRERADASGLTPRFSGVDSPAAVAAQQLRERETALGLAIGTAFAGLITLIITVGLLAAIYADTVRFSSFLKRIHGWSWIRTHGLFVVAVITGSALMIHTGLILGELLELGSAGVLQTVAAAMTGTVTAVVIVAAASFDRRARAALVKRR